MCQLKFKVTDREIQKRQAAKRCDFVKRLKCAEYAVV